MGFLGEIFVHKCFHQRKTYDSEACVSYETYKGLANHGSALGADEGIRRVCTELIIHGGVHMEYETTNKKISRKLGPDGLA